jgi:hypothetical protein
MLCANVIGKEKLLEPKVNHFLALIGLDFCHFSKLHGGWLSPLGED